MKKKKQRGAPTVHITNRIIWHLSVLLQLVSQIDLDPTNLVRQRFCFFVVDGQFLQGFTLALHVQLRFLVRLEHLTQLKQQEGRKKTGVVVKQ